MVRILLLILPLFIFNSCKKAKTLAEIDDETIIAYLEKHSIDATKTKSGLYYTIGTIGAGGHPTSTSTVTVAYKGYFVNETVFDQSPSSGLKFNLAQVIKGWTEGIPYFKKGGEGKLFIPSALGYGKQGTNGIPPSSVLIFDIHLMDVH